MTNHDEASHADPHAPTTSPQHAHAAKAKTIGIVGGGQLGRMLAGAALRLGLDVRVFQTHRSGPVDAAARVFTGSWDDHDTLRAFVDGCDVVTLEHEWANLGALTEVLPAHVPLWPSPRTMDLVRDKLVQKQHAQARGLPVGAFAQCASVEQLRHFGETHGYPFMLKRPTHSYDGYGNRKIDSADDLEPAFEDLVDDGRVLAEAWVPFRRELAVMVARTAAGERAEYPVCATIQRNNQCVSVEAPASSDPAVVRAAIELARTTVDAFDCVGVTGVEMFETHDGQVLLNEIAPRPHNSGHYTLDACMTSQFENHLRAVLGYPLGSTELLGAAAVMVNVVGARHGESSSHALADALGVQGVAVHVYGKRLVRPGRKMAHVTAISADLPDARRRANEAAQRLQF